MPKKIITIIINLLFCVLILGIMYFLINYKFYIVASGSMQPTINVDELIVIRKNAEYKVGDIITFITKNSIIPTTHRIIQIDTNGQIHTQGDFNNIEDMNTINKDNIIGKVVFHSMLLGKLLKKHRIHLLILFILFIFIQSIKDKEVKRNET